MNSEEEEEEVDGVGSQVKGRKQKKRKSIKGVEVTGNHASFSYSHLLPLLFPSPCKTASVILTPKSKRTFSEYLQLFITQSAKFNPSQNQRVQRHCCVPSTVKIDGQSSHDLVTLDDKVFSLSFVHFLAGRE
ncbi:hypothetical protein VNO80_15432 [Phaseolus coccineus]|uniref:Uncharacterized protein n=1 Tax=Phaseolus coccineus TaxID=3886 RepID=A0AAN9R2B3_PHACN